MIGAIEFLTLLVSCYVAAGTAVSTATEFLRAKATRDYSVAWALTAILLAELAALGMADGSTSSIIGLWCIFGGLTLAVGNLVRTHRRDSERRGVLAAEIRSCLRECPR